MAHKNQDLNSWAICDPENTQDPLPQPYRLIDEVLSETILYKLSLALHHIQQKKKDSNYQGEVKEYIAQGTMDIEGICCFSAKVKTHNHLLAGDKGGNVYLLDPAKKSVFSKKEIVPQKRVLKISEALLTDGETMITTLAVVLNNHPIITILRYKHFEPKLYITYEVIVAEENQENVGKMPYDCQLEDSGRVLIVKTYEGGILGFDIPEIEMDIDAHTKTSSVPMLEEDIKKLLKYPLKMVSFEGLAVGKIKERSLQLNFEGYKAVPKYSQLLDKLKKKKKQVPASEPEPAKKDAKKKDDKKPVPEQAVEQAAEQSNLQFNPRIQKREPEIENALDNTESYPEPKYKPYVYFLNGSYTLPKSKYFQKGTTVQVPNRILYGWTNTKEFYVGQIRQQLVMHDIFEYLYVAYFQQKAPEDFLKKKSESRKQKLIMKNVQKLSNLSSVSCTDLSLPDELFLACGLTDGTVAIWNTKTCNSQMVTDRHELPVTTVKIFDSWKVISGSQKGSIHIDNIIENRNQVKRTNVFQSKYNLPITNLSVNELGLAFALDSEGHLRVYDLWRSEKISRAYPCTSFALVEDRGKRWLPALNIKPCESIYSNRDFTVLLSTNWPNVPVRMEDASQQEIEKLKLYNRNPWKCQGTNVHIIRNFQFLLHNFEGLQSTYKKGYERKKIENLFSNLEFSQLYDRNFDIPDFGRTAGIKKTPRNNNTNMNRSSYSSIQSEARKTNKTNHSKSKGKFQEVSPSKLTKEILHPEKFLLERRVVQKRDIVTEEHLTGLLRAEHQKKQRREILLNNDISKMGL